MVFSYLLGPNPAYRLALHVFLGGTIGYAAGATSWEVFVLRLGAPLAAERRWLALAPLALGIILMVKLFPRRAYLGNLSLGFLMGVGAAVALSGALLGTLIPVGGATARAATPASWATMPLGWLDGLLLIAGTLCTLAAFRTIGRRDAARPRSGSLPVRGITWLGRWFLIVAFGALFGGAVSTALTIFTGRAQYLVEVIGGLFR
jgi:hypothetical protein